jgi:hypothetical protein
VKNPLALTLVAVLIMAAAPLGCGSGSHLVSVGVSPNPINMTAPSTLQLKAIGTYSDGSTHVLGSATWAVSSPFVTITSTGLATCKGQGGPVSDNGTVTATFGGVSGSAKAVCQGNQV